MKNSTLAAVLISLSATISTPLFAADIKMSTSVSAKTSLANAKVNQAFLSEVRARAIKAKLSSSQIDSLLSNLASMNFTQVDGLVKGQSSQLSRLVGVNASTQASANSASQRVVGNMGAVSSSGSNNAMSAAISGQMSNHGGIRGDRTGQLSSEGKCDGQACAVGAGGNPNDGNETTRQGKGKNGEETFQYGDGSVRIKYTNGKEEVVDTDGELFVRDSTSPIYAKVSTPNPDDDGGSGRPTADDKRGIDARAGAKGGVVKEGSNPGAGGLVTSRTTAAGTPVDVQSQTVVDLVQLQEIIRISAEKFGPKVK